MKTIAFVGLGNMGLPMATNLLKSGYEVVGWDVSPDHPARAEAAGIRGAGSLTEAVADADAVITMLPSGSQVTEVYLDPDGILASTRPDTLLVDCSTIDVATARKAELAARQGGHRMLDAPVSGGVGGAVAGTLTFMVGGAGPAVEAAGPVLEPMAGRVIHAGDAGAGQAAKICNNMMLGIQMISVAEAFALADRLGLERRRLFDIAAAASGQCWSLTTYCPVPGPVPTSPANRGYEPGFTAAMMLKDLRLAQEAARLTDAATPLGAGAETLYSLFCNADGGARDFSAIFEMLNRKPNQGF